MKLNGAAMIRRSFGTCLHIYWLAELLARAFGIFLPRLLLLELRRGGTLRIRWMRLPYGRVDWESQARS